MKARINKGMVIFKKITIIIFLCSIILTIVLGSTLKRDCDTLGGDAISGYRNDKKFYIMIDDFQYIEVPRIIWIKNITLWITTLSFGILSAVSMITTVIMFFRIPSFFKI